MQVPDIINLQKPNVMKTYMLCLAIVFINMLTLRTTAQNKKFNFKAMHVSVDVMNGNEPMIDYAVIMYRDGVKMDSVFIDDEQAFDIVFFVNQVYTFEFKKEGFVTKTALIDATVPDGLKNLSRKTSKIGVSMTKTWDYIPAITPNTSDVFMIDKGQGMLTKFINAPITTQLNNKLMPTTGYSN